MEGVTGSIPVPPTKKSVQFERSNGNVQGYAKPDTRHVAVSPLAVNPAKALMHEMAHCLTRRIRLTTASRARCRCG